MLRRLFLFSFAGLLLGQLAFAENPYQKWQGEWGQWDQNQKGASFSISNCTTEKAPYSPIHWNIRPAPALAKCSLRFNRDESNTFSDDLFILSDTVAIATQSMYNCDMQLIRYSEGKNSFLELKFLAGPSCKEYGKQTKFPLRTVYNYPDDYRELSLTPDYKITCYTDNSPYMQSWCNSPEVTQFELKLFNLSQKMQDDTLSFQDLTEDWRKNMLKFCRTQKNSLDCFTQQYQEKLTAAENDFKKLTTNRTNLTQKLHNQGDPEKAANMIEKIAGVYKVPVKYTDQDGTVERLEDILEIVKVANDIIYFRINMTHGNGHGCELNGLAKFNNEGNFIFDDHAHNYSKKVCLLKIVPGEKNITLTEADDEKNCQAYCSAIGGWLSGSEFPVTRHRRIRYMERLINSTEYKAAIATIKEH